MSLVNIKIGQSTYNDIGVLTVDRTDGGVARFLYENFARNVGHYKQSITTTNIISGYSVKAPIYSSSIIKEE